jgi:hypothetical protein
MPFTFAHPAAILPLRRRFKTLQTVPLIVGSVAPDLPYFIPARLSRLMLETHSFSGSFWMDVPIGMATLILGFLFRRPLVALLTPRARALCLQSVEHFRDQPLHWVLAPFAILLGTWTHLLWDSFTHDNGWVVRRVAALSAPITFGGYTGTMCHVLQYVSSLAGLAILAIWFRRLPTPDVEPPAVGALSTHARTVLLALVCVTAAAIGGYRAMQAADQATATNYRVIYTLLTRSISWFAGLYFVVGLFVSFTRKPEPVAQV